MPCVEKNVRGLHPGLVSVAVKKSVEINPGKKVAKTAAKVKDMVCEEPSRKQEKKLRDLLKNVRDAAKRLEKKEKEATGGAIFLTM